MADNLQFFAIARQAKATCLLIILNTLHFVFSHLFDTNVLGSLGRDSFLLQWGAALPQLIFAGEYWRLFTGLFLHVNVMHFAINMVALWCVGTVLEKRIPRVAFFGIYFISGLVGNLLSNIANIDKEIISCGASGAILGLITALLAYFMVTRTNSKEMPVNSLLLSLLFTLGLGYLPFIDNVAHIGGAVTGFVLELLISICVTKLTYSGKLSILTQIILLILPVIGVYKGYMHYQTPNGQVQLDASTLIQILRTQGVGHHAYRNSYIQNSDSCLYEQLHHSPIDMNQARQCGLPIFTHTIYDDMKRCLTLTSRLRAHYPDQQDQQRLDIVENYCSSRKNLYGLAMGTQANITIQELNQATKAMYQLAKEIKQISYYKDPLSWQHYDEDELFKDVRVGVLTDIDPVLFDLVYKTRAPY